LARTIQIKIMSGQPTVRVWVEDVVMPAYLPLAHQDFSRAANHFADALKSPENLGEAKHLPANQSDIHYWLGVALNWLGEKKSAREHWQGAVEAGSSARPELRPGGRLAGSRNGFRLARAQTRSNFMSRAFIKLNIVLAALVALTQLRAEPASTNPPARLLLDFTHNNPGEPFPQTAFLDPRRLADWGYNGQVNGSIASIQTFDTLAPGLLPEGSVEREWARGRAEELRRRVKAAHDAGIKFFAGTDVFVLPKALVQQFRDEICDERGRIDIHRPKTQEIFCALLRETFERVPELDGIVVRTGEVYLQEYPYHAASADTGESQRQGNSAILRGPQSHVELIRILRDEVCVKRGKTVIYRTWSFGPNSFHENPKYYLEVTDAIEPHPNLVFSVKHQKGDFHQLTPFNPTLMIGRHRQLVEVQCQREAYGKGAHPYYIGQGVIEGWEEYAWLMKPGAPRGLRDVVTNALCAGVWTWSRGGGWEGPYIRNELWCELNAYVVSQFARNPARGEEDIFNEFARGKLGLRGGDVAKFRELNLLSTRAVLRGQLTTLGANINVWWARDHFLDEPDLSDFIRKGLVEKALAEKAEAVAMWKRIEELARQIHFPDAATQEFVESSATYGCIKYAIIEQAWTILFYGKMGDASGQYDRERLGKAIGAYDVLWSEWKDLKQKHPACATLYLDVGFDHKPGLGAAVNRYRRVLDASGKAPGRDLLELLSKPR
jgi:hypothetical protein